MLSIPTQNIPVVVALARAAGPCPDSDTVRSRDWLTGLSSSFVRDRLMAEWGTKAPGVLKGYTDLVRETVKKFPGLLLADSPLLFRAINIIIGRKLIYMFVSQSEWLQERDHCTV